MTQGWIVSTAPLTAEEFIEGQRIRRYHYCFEGTSSPPHYKSWCGRLTLGGRRLRVLPGKPSRGAICESCLRLYEAALAGERGTAG